MGRWVGGSLGDIKPSIRFDSVQARDGVVVGDMARLASETLKARERLVPVWRVCDVGNGWEEDEKGSEQGAIIRQAIYFKKEQAERERGGVKQFGMTWAKEKGEDDR